MWKGQSLQQMLLGKLNIHMQKTEAEHLTLHHIQKFIQNGLKI